MAWRLRGSGLSPIRRVAAIGLEAGIPSRQLIKEVLPALESVDWVELSGTEDGVIEGITEHVPPPTELLVSADAILDIAMPTALERAALVLLRETSRLPLEVTTAVELASVETSEVAARQALGALSAVHLVRIAKTDEGREVVFNPFIWQGDPALLAAALRAEDAGAHREIGALIEEIAARPTLPQDHVTSTEPKWVDFAVSQGLIQRTVVETSTGQNRAFLFSPHLARDPFGVTSGDPSGHVRQLVGSMIYATTFASNKLYDPKAFLNRLLIDGEAGDATVIGTDYTMLETAGIVRVEPGYRYKKMVLLQPDVAEEAAVYIEGGQLPGGVQRASSLMDQSAYGHLERERARIAATSDTNSEDHRRLMSALRGEAGRRRF
jgi:hypothetical protein